jgi:hypothetical protein
VEEGSDSKKASLYVKVDRAFPSSAKRRLQPRPTAVTVLPTASQTRESWHRPSVWVALKLHQISDRPLRARDPSQKAGRTLRESSAHVKVQEPSRIPQGKAET